VLRPILRRAALALLLATAPAAGTLAQSSAPATLSPDQVQAIEKVIREYLLRNPELLLEAIENLEKRRGDEAQSAAKTVIAERRAELLNDPGSPVVGNANGDVAIVEFFDYRCPYCKQVVPSLAQLLKEDPKLRLVHKELPILGPESVVASRAALAARKQGKYHEMHVALMRTRALDEASILKLASDQGLDSARLKADMQSAETDEIIERNRRLARALNISGTPAFVIGDAVVPGAIDLRTLKSLVAEARAKK
jgi:protein-disulfide isomerase